MGQDGRRLFAEYSTTRFEVAVNISLSVIDGLASRIERAYRRKRLNLVECGLGPRVWETAAALLAELQRSEPWIPLDPEFFVASQDCVALLADPWKELANPRAISRYRRRVRQSVAYLRREIASEVRHAERRSAAGDRLEDVLLEKDRRLSDMGRFIVAHRARMFSLRESFRSGAQLQHRSCPLYREACRSLIAARDYPVLRIAYGIELVTEEVRGLPGMSRN